MTDVIELADKDFVIDIIKFINIFMNLKEDLNLMKTEMGDTKRMKGNI